MSEKRTWVRQAILKRAKDAVRALRIELEGNEPWLDLDGDDMVIVQRVWERDKLESYVEHLSQLEDMLAGVLALAE